MSTGAKFLYRFSVGELNYTNPGANVISVTSTAAGDHNKKNLTTYPLRQTWRSTTTANQEIVIQTNDTTINPDVFAILNHNLSENAVVQLYGNNSNSWGAPAFSGVIPWNKKNMAYIGSLTAYNYWKIKISDAGNACGYVEVGRILAGKAFTLVDNEDIQDDIGVKTDDLAYKMNTEGFFLASNKRVRTQNISMVMPKLNTRSTLGATENYENMLTFADFVGETLSFLTVVDPGDPYFKIIWGQFSSMPTEDYTVNRYATFKLEIKEVY